MNAFTVCLCNHCSGKYITRQHSEEVSLCPRCVARSKFRGYASQQVTHYLHHLHKRLVPWPRMTLVHDPHHGYTDQLWPTLQCPKELQCDCCSFLSLGRWVLRPALSGSSHRTLSSAGWQWSPARSFEKPSFCCSWRCGREGTLRARRQWYAFQLHFTTVRTSVGERCQFAFCCIFST